MALLGRKRLGDCPAWPPDVFAVAATLLRRSGAYVNIVETWQRPPRWAEQCRAAAMSWREAWVRGERPPPPVLAAWRRLTEHGLCPLGADLPPRLLDALMQLLAIADETAFDVGTTSRHPFVRDAELPLALSATLGREVSPHHATVLPKMHTPRAGMTLRSLSHHLALLEAPDVSPLWFSRPMRERPVDRLGILLLPWPLEVSPHAFSAVRASKRNASGFGSFRYQAPAFELNRALSAFEEAERRTGIDMIVLPEQAVTERDAITLAKRTGAIVVAGVHGGARGRRNESVVCDPYGMQMDGPEVFARSQAKHHRWCLDESQIRRYGLSRHLDPGKARAYWEDIVLGKREVFFHTADDDLTWSVLVCEDLARQDPLADVLRSVGPSLVLALLLDGPQLRHRWPGRYAGVLAEDPGSSVLTLTSYGMAQLSRPPSPVIALFGDGATGETTELAAAPGAVGLAVTLVQKPGIEFTADGRGAECHHLRIESILDVHETLRRG